MNKAFRVKNIKDMENSYNKLESSLDEMKKSFSKWKKLLPEYKKLMKYYEGEQRKKDYDDVNNGKLKPEGPHGILSEDTIYDFYQEQREFCLEIKKVIDRVLKG